MSTHTPLAPTRAEVETGRRYAEAAHATLTHGRGVANPTPAHVVGLRALALHDADAVRLAAALVETIQADLHTHTGERLTAAELASYLAHHLAEEPAPAAVEAVRAALEGNR
jgi:hypothetical protein